jgi:hypothetical protein
VLLLPITQSIGFITALRRLTQTGGQIRTGPKLSASGQVRQL